MTSRTLIASFLVLSLAGPSLAGEFKVPSAGNETISKALDRAKPGDTVTVAPGTYKEFLSLPTGVHLVGAGASRTRLVAPEAGCVVSVVGARDAWIDGFTLKAEPGARVLDASESSFTVTNCVFEDSGEGVGLMRCFVTTIANNRFKNCKTGVRAARSFAYVGRNVFEGGGAGEQAVLGLQAVLYVDRNTLSSFAWGIALTGPSSSTLRSNVIYRTSEGGVKLEDQVSALARNNLIVESPTGFFLDYAKATISHNAVHGVERPYVKLDEDSGEEAEFEPDPGVGCLRADPRFKAADRGDFTLSEGSALAGAGVRYPHEPESTKADIGAYPAGDDQGLGPREDRAEREKMKPDPENLSANCIDEEYVYLRNTPCDCGGQYKPGKQALQGGGGRHFDALFVKCGSCGKERKFRFEISRFFSEPFLVTKDK